MVPLLAESWTWFAVTTVIFAARMTSRSLLFGTVHKLQIDDWVMALAWASYVVFIATINIVATHDSNLLPEDYDIRLLTVNEIERREYGSKMILVVEQCQCIAIWAVKACLLIMYHRLTIALSESIIVKLLAGYVAFGFVFMEIFYFGVWCRPFRMYWAVPTHKQCSTAQNHLITNAVFNLTSDIVMLGMALQMLIRSRLPARRKVILCGIFGLGIFVILSAVLNKYYSFSNPYGSMWTYWYVRESSTAIIVANLPYTWTLLRRLFNLSAFDRSLTRSEGESDAQDEKLHHAHHTHISIRGVPIPVHIHDAIKSPPLSKVTRSSRNGSAVEERTVRGASVAETAVGSLQQVNSRRTNSATGSLGTTTTTNNTNATAAADFQAYITQHGQLDRDFQPTHPYAGSTSSKKAKRRSNRKSAPPELFTSLGGSAGTYLAPPPSSPGLFPPPLTPRSRNSSFTGRAELEALDPDWGLCSSSEDEGEGEGAGNAGGGGTPLGVGKPLARPAEAHTRSLSVGAGVGWQAERGKIIDARNSGDGIV